MAWERTVRCMSRGTVQTRDGFDHNLSASPTLFYRTRTRHTYVHDGLGTVVCHSYPLQSIVSGVSIGGERGLTGIVVTIDNIAFFHFNVGGGLVILEGCSVE